MQKKLFRTVPVIKYKTLSTGTAPVPYLLNLSISDEYFRQYVVLPEPEVSESLFAGSGSKSLDFGSEIR
jgi:hypothetical protein